MRIMNRLDIKMLISLINGAKFVIANDTGPAHIASHLNKKDLFYLEVILQLKKLV